MRMAEPTGKSSKYPSKTSGSKGPRSSEWSPRESKSTPAESSEWKPAPSRLPQSESKPTHSETAEHSRPTDNKPQHPTHTFVPATTSTSRRDAPAAPSTTVVQHGQQRILLVAEIRGQLSLLNSFIDDTEADVVISCGNFGFFDEDSAKRVPERCLPNAQSTARSVHKSRRAEVYGELPAFIRGEEKLHAPVYTVTGSFEDVHVVAKFRSGEYKVPNLHLIDERSTYLIAGLRVFGLGGALEYHKLFDYGEGVDAEVAGGEGRMWMTALQIGQLLDTVQKVHNPRELRLFVSFASPFHEGWLTQLAIQTQASLTVTKSSTNIDVNFYESTVHPIETIDTRLAAAKTEADAVWAEVRSQVENACSSDELQLIQNAIKVTEITECPLSYYREAWHIGICNVRRLSQTILSVKDSYIGIEMFHAGLDFSRAREEGQERMEVRPMRGREDATRPHEPLTREQRIKALEPSRTVEVKPQIKWDEKINVEAVKAFFHTSKPVALVFPEGPKGTLLVQLDSAETARNALKSDGKNLLRGPVSVSPYKPTAGAH